MIHITRREFVTAGGITLLASPNMLTAAEPDFTIALLPDMQYMADSGTCPNASTGSKAYIAVMNQILALASSMNIKGVWSLGDCANVVAALTKNAQDTIVEAGYNTLSAAGMPYQTCLGNHDYLSVSARTAGYLWTNAAGIFYPSQQSARFGSGITLSGGDRALWGGARSSTSGESTYSLWYIGSWRILLISMSFYPTSAELAWVNTVMAAYADHTVLIVTHGWVTGTGVLFGRSGYGPDGFSMGDSPSSNSPEQMWGSSAGDGGFIQLKYAPNLGGVFSGHDIANGDSGSYYYRRLTLTSSSRNAQTTQHIFCNLQQVDLAAQCGGSPPDGTSNTAHVQFLTFSPASGTCTVRVQSMNSGNYLLGRTTPGWTGSNTPIDTFNFGMLPAQRNMSIGGRSSFGGRTVGK